MPEHVDLTDPELHEPKGVSTATSNQTYVANGAGSGVWSEPEPKGVSGANSGEVYVANGAGSGAWTERVDLFQRNVSNGANSTSCSAGVDTNVPLLGNGSFNFTSVNVTTGKLQFDASYNSGQGGLIIDQLPSESDISLRITFTNTTGGAADATIKAFLDDDKTAPGTGTQIVTSPLNAGTGVAQTANLKFFKGTQEAIRIQINSSATKNYSISGCYATVVTRG